MTGSPLLNAIIFTVLGLIAFGIAGSILAKSAPFNVWKHVVEERNVAVAIVAGAVALGIAWIIAATMH